MVEPFAPGPFDLAQDRQRAQAALRQFRLEERIHRRQPATDAVRHRHRQQPARAVVAGQPHLHEARLGPAADQELVELDGAVAIHAAIAMACGQVALVQLEMLGGAPRRRDPRLDVGIACQAAALAAVGLEGGHRDAHGHAGAALLAVRPVDQVAGAAESPVQRLRVDVRQARVARVEHEVARAAFGPVAAGMATGLEQAQVVGRGGVVAHGGAVGWPQHTPVPGAGVRAWTSPAAG